MRLEHMPAAAKYRIRILLRLFHEQRDIARQRLYVVVADEDEVVANELAMASLMTQKKFSVE
jgi:hypothetical protein